MADALADGGCRGEEEGFAQGQPLLDPETPPPLVSEVPRYVWHVMRAVAVSLSDSGEVVVSSSFLGRSRITKADVEYVGPREWLPLREPPRGDPGWDVFCAARDACTQEHVCHFRPQAIVFEAEGRDAEEACDRATELVEAGLGQRVVELLLPAGMGDWDRRVACGRCMRAVAREDVVEAPAGWAPPGGEEGGWEEEGGWDSVPQPPGPGAVRPPTPVKTYGEREGGGPMVFWPRRVPRSTAPGAVALGAPAAAVGAASSAARAASTAAPRAFAGWGEDGRELSRALLPARVCRPVPLRPADAPALPALVAPLPSRVSVRPVRACAADELGDDDMRSVREFVRGAGWRGALGGWAGTARGYWHRFLSAASWPLELPSHARRFATARAVREPPD